MRRNCTRFIVMSAMLFCAATAFAQDIHLNEIYASHAGTDDQEMIELIGTPDIALDNLMVLIVEGEGGGAGTLDRAWDLTGYVMPSDGYFLMGDSAVPGIDYDLGSDNNIENGTETFYLVDAPDPSLITALLGTNVDPDGDLVTDIPGLSTILDIIAMVNDDYPVEDKIYDGTDFRGPDGTYFPPGIYRALDYPNDWAFLFLDFDDEANANMPRTPGFKNSPGFVPKDLYLNEIYASHAGTDDQEHIELIGTPDELLDNVMVLVVEGQGAGAGTLDRAWDLTTFAMRPDGFFLMGDTAVPGIDYDLGSDNNIENGTETFYLVQANDPADITALLGTNIDPDGDGISVIPDLAVILDIIAMVDDDYPAEDMIYDGTDFRGPDGSYFPAGIFRGLDYPNDWCFSFLDFDDEVNEDMPRTPGAPNGPCWHSTMNITEYMYNGADGDFIELTNTGNYDVDMTGFSFDNSAGVPGTVDLSAFGMVEPGESVIVTTAADVDFISDWNLVDVKVIGSSGVDLGQDDEINLYDPIDAVIDVLSYGPTGFPVSVDADGAGAWPCQDVVGLNDIYGWIGSHVTDYQLSYASNGGDVGNPGMYKSALCQKDIGFGGPGDGKLWVVGDELATGGRAQLLLTYATASEPAFLFVGLDNNPTFIMGGFVVPNPPIFVLAFMTDGNGEVFFKNVCTGGGPLTVYAQIVYADGSQPEGYGFSNALEAEYLP